MVVATQRLTPQRLANALADRLEMYGMKRGNPKLVHDKFDSRWCKLAIWTAAAKSFDVYAYFGDYLGYGEMLWVGFGSPKIDIIQKIRDELGGQQVTQVSVADWETMWNRKSSTHVALLSSTNIALEDYSDDGNDIWIGRYLTIEADTLARSQKFILNILKEIDPVIFSSEDDIEWSGPAEKFSNVKTRLAQNAFRRGVESYWGGRCAVTGSMLKAALRASHIISWAEGTDEEKKSVHNGLLLTAALDALFDRGYISFNDTGGIIISNLLTDDELKIYALSHDLKLRVAPSSKQLKFLRRHQYKHRKRLGLAKN